MEKHMNEWNATDQEIHITRTDLLRSSLFHQALPMPLSPISVRMNGVHPSLIRVRPLKLHVLCIVKSLLRTGIH